MFVQGAPAFSTAQQSASWVDWQCTLTLGNKRRACVSPLCLIRIALNHSPLPVQLFMLMTSMAACYVPNLKPYLTTPLVISHQCQLSVSELTQQPQSQ